MSGMSESQKNRLRGHLEKFKKINGGCILCDKPVRISEYNYVPEQTDQNGVPLPHIRLHVLGCCSKHAALVNNEEKMEQAVAARSGDYTTDADRPKLMTVEFSKPDEEEVKWAV